MTPEERRLITELFDRLATLEDAERDREAERLIRDGLRQAPNAPYALVQTVLVQDEALKRADARIRELQGGRQAPEQDTSFLGTMRDTLFGGEKRGSVPSVRPGVSEGGMSPAWHTGTQSAQSVPPTAVAPGAPSPGGSFLGTAAAAAAGMIGGSLMLDGIRSMMGHPSGAHAAFDPSGGGSAGPWRGGAADSGLARDAGIDDIGRASGTEDRTSGHRLLGDNDDVTEEEEEDQIDDLDDVDPGSDDASDV
jgi:uncharacterized protein